MHFYILYLIFLSALSLATSNSPEAIQQAEKAVWKIYDYKGNGTGFFISPKHFVTNLHVVFHNLSGEDFSFEKFKLSQKGKKSKIKFKNLINLSFAHDLAIFETDQEVSHYLTLPSETPKLTDSIFAIGYPQSLFQIIKNTSSNFLENDHVVKGYFNLSSLEGASGSSVLNKKGELIGVANSASFNLLTFIKMNHLKKLMESPKNKGMSIESFIKEKMLEPNDMISQYIMGMIFYDNERMSEKYMQNSFQLIKKSAEKGYAPAQTMLGMIFYQGERVGQDFEQALYWLEQAAEQENAQAQYQLGVMYYNEEGVDRNFEKALHLFTLIAKQGHAQAQYNLGYIFYQGEEVEQNFEKAIYWYEQAAKQRNVQAQYELAIMFRDEEGIEKDLNKSFYWMQLAAEQGDANAQYELGYMLYQGEGVKKDLDKARDWYELAAKQDDALAQHALGVILYDDYKDIKKAIYWLKKSAKQGCDQAEIMLETIEEKMKSSNKCQIAF